MKEKVFLCLLLILGNCFVGESILLRMMSQEVLAPLVTISLVTIKAWLGEEEMWDRFGNWNWVSKPFLPGWEGVMPLQHITLLGVSARQGKLWVLVEFHKWRPNNKHGETCSAVSLLLSECLYASPICQVKMQLWGIVMKPGWSGFYLGGQVRRLV